MIEKIKTFMKSESFKKLFKFCVTGGLNTVVDFLVYSLVAGVLLQNVYLAQTAGYLACVANSYIINRSWTFKKEKAGFFSSQLVKFLIVNAITYGISLAAMHLLVEVWAVHWLLAKVFVTPATILVNFLLSNLWAFKKK